MKIIRGNQIPFIPASHEDKESPQVWKKVLLTHKDFVNSRVQMINWAKLPEGCKFKTHYHEDMEEVFIIVSGKVRVRGGEEEIEVGKGDAVVIPPLIEHEMENLVNHDVEYIVIGITTTSGGRTVVV